MGLRGYRLFHLRDLARLVIILPVKFVCFLLEYLLTNPPYDMDEWSNTVFPTEGGPCKISRANEDLYSMTYSSQYADILQGTLG